MHKPIYLCVCVCALVCMPAVCIYVLTDTGTNKTRLLGCLRLSIEKYKLT